MNELPTSLEYLGEYAFRRSGPNIKFSVIPNKLKALPDWCLGGCPEITINHFGGSESSLTTIGSNVFYNSGSSSVTTLTFEAPVTTMNAESLFKSSGHENYEKSITTINTHSLFGYDNSDDWEIALFGWRNPNGTLDTEHLRVDEITTNLTA